MFVLKDKKDSGSFFIWKLKKMENLICIFYNFLMRQLYCNQRECLNKNIFLKTSQYSPWNTYGVFFS